ncbi:pitrilysin family protein [Granulosicoccaceae sp. 1_MG-2023]|nr:pitrilysin family protein [Granulosicoccaceae sp. 1_MG-2023]
MYVKQLLAAGLLALLSPMAGASLAQLTLDNGLRVIVEPDHRAPVVVQQIWYDVGSLSEHDGITGISHVLEHMMFKGTPAHPQGEFQALVARLGGEENAFTSKAYTSYYQQIAAAHLDRVMALEADRMRNTVLSEAEFGKELKVVQEERRSRVDDRPQSLLYERFLATAFSASPERLPVIGWPADLQALTLAELQDWYERWYVPNNAVLVVVGDVLPETVFALAKKHYGPIPAGQLRPAKARPEPEQKGPRRLSMTLPAQLPYLLIGFKVPSLATAQTPQDAYALSVLAGILDGGSSARLTRDLVRTRRLAASAGASYSMLKRDTTLFLLDATPAGEVTVAQLEEALLAELSDIASHGVTADELDRVKAQVIAADVFDRDSMFRKAVSIGSLAVQGFDVQLRDDYVAGIQAVTAAQVQSVVQRYLVPAGMTVGVLQPQGDQQTEAGQ